MYKIKTSIDKLFGAGLFGWLLVLFILAGDPSKIEGQVAPDLKKPFKKCWDYEAKSGSSQILASDNESRIIFSNNGNSVISIDPSNRLENWQTEISGKTQQNTISDDRSLFFLTEYESIPEPEKTEKIITLNAISLKTGITRWQEKIAGESGRTQIKPVDNKEFIFVATDEMTLSAIQKTDGSILWKKTFPSLIASVDSTSQAEIKLLTENTLFRIKAKTGEILEETKVENIGLKSSVLKETYMIVGNSAGEIIKTIFSEGRMRVSWRIKTGGSISNLMVLEEGVLATSLDNFIYLFSLEDGNLKWKRRVSGRINQNPLIFKDYAVVVNSADSYSSVINLRDGKVINQIQIGDDNYFSGSPKIFRNFLILQSYKRIYFFVNADTPC